MRMYVSTKPFIYLGMCVAEAPAAVMLCPLGPHSGPVPGQTAL